MRSQAAHETQRRSFLMDGVFRLDDRVVLITGAAGGIGSAIIDVLSKAGAITVAIDVRDRFAGDGGSAATVSMRVDITSEKAVSEAFRKVVAEFGRVDVLVNNAGLVRFAALADIEESDWTEMFDVNVKGTFFCCRTFVRHLVSRGAPGKIVNVSSSAGRIGYANHAHYCSAKAAVLGLTKALAVELAPRGITVNAVCPGPINTPMLDLAIREQSKLHGMDVAAYEQKVISSIPLGRKAEPEDVAAAVAYLSSPASDNVTGQTLGVDGGIVRL